MSPTMMMMTDDEASIMEDSSSYDATDVFFRRGEFLRKLREMEAQDDAEREQENQAAALLVAATGTVSNAAGMSASSDTLHYESQYLQNQSYWDDYKHVNYRFIDFGFIPTCRKERQPPQSEQQQQQPLILEQDRKYGKGGLIWDAGVILAEHVIYEQEEWKPLQGKVVHHAQAANNNNNNNAVQMVELGAGTGVTGLMVASALPQDVHVSLTDLPELMPLLQKNLAHNTSNATTLTTIGNTTTTKDGVPPVSVFPLPWGSNVTGNYDVILGADVVAGIYDPVKLAKTICDLCHEHTIVYISVNSRLLEAIATFETAMVRLFDRVEIRAPMSRNKNPNVSILVATGKRSNQ